MIMLEKLTPEVEKSNFYRDLEGVLDWEESDDISNLKCGFERESEEKQSGVNRSRFSLSLCFCDRFRPQFELFRGSSSTLK